jgi:hypothetical protein
MLFQVRCSPDNEKEDIPVTIFRTGLYGFLILAAALLVANHAIADEDASRKACDSVPAKNSF